MVFNVTLLQEVNGIKFGTKRSEVRSIFGDATEFKKTKFCKNTTDDFGFCHVFYNNNDEFEAIEIFDYDDILIDGISISSKDLNAIQEMFEDAEDECGFISKKSSVGVYAPDGIIESFVFGSKGYYEFE